MTGRWVKTILLPPLRALGTMALVVALTLPLLLGTPGGAAAAPDPLEQRLLAWPAWSLPAPLPRPGRRDLVWPAWFAGDWEVSSEDAEGETTVVGRRSALPSDQGFLADELSLQVLHGPGEPRIQRVEVLGRWQLRPDGVIDGEQWQASYPSPAEGLAASGQRPRHLRLRLSPLPPGSDPTS